MEHKKGIHTSYFKNHKNFTKEPKMKIFAIISAALFNGAVGEETHKSLLAGTDMGQCGTRDCVSSHKENGATVCVEITEGARDFYGNGIGEIGSQRCFCVYAYNWVTSKKNLDLPIVAAKTHECAYKFLTSTDYATVEDGERSSDETSADRC